MPRPLIINNVLLLLFCSIYLGTGVSLVFFQFPIEPVANATQFFPYMTVLMLITGVIMLITEWFSGLRWIPVVVLLAIISSTALELVVIFPLNNELSAGVTDPERLKVIFNKWANMNRIRVALWVIQWTAMAYWFYRMTLQARADR